MWFGTMSRITPSPAPRARGTPPRRRARRRSRRGSTTS
jgi:hypothetical protein